MRDSICVLSGGTGTPKLLQGLVKLVEPGQLNIVVNTGDDIMVGDIYVSPDIDTVLYTLAGIVDQEKWYGVAGDTYSVYEERRRRGLVDILRVGDRDRENAAFRTRLLHQGYPLSYAVEQQRKRLGIPQQVHPMTDSKVTTKVVTPAGVKEFQEFWVRDQGRDDVLGVEFEGIDGAILSNGARSALDSARLVIIGPSNPITSIGPIVRTSGVAERLEDTKVVAVSPIRGGAPFSGPAGKMLTGLGYEVSPVSIAAIYSRFLDELIIDRSEAHLAQGISDQFGLKVRLAEIEMRTAEDKFKLARAALAGATEGEKDGR